MKRNLELTPSQRCEHGDQAVHCEKTHCDDVTSHGTEQVCIVLGLTAADRSNSVLVDAAVATASHLS